MRCRRRTVRKRNRQRRGTNRRRLAWPGKASYGLKKYAVGLEISCPGGAYHWAPEIPSKNSIAGGIPSKCELAHNPAHSFQTGAGSGPRLKNSELSLAALNLSFTKAMQPCSQTATEPEVEPAVARRSRRCNARRLFQCSAIDLASSPSSAHLSRTGVTKSVVPEICAAAWIKRPKPLHAVSDRVSGRRTVRHGGRRAVIARTIIARGVGGGQRTAHDCPADNSSGNRRAPSPTSAPPLHGLGNIRGGFGDRKRLANRCRMGGAAEHNEAAGQQG
jgi:hypothetical protein